MLLKKTPHNLLYTHHSLQTHYLIAAILCEKMADSFIRSGGAHSFLLPRLLHFIFLKGTGQIVSTGSPQVQARGARACCDYVLSEWSHHLYKPVIITDSFSKR